MCVHVSWTTARPAIFFPSFPVQPPPPPQAHTRTRTGSLLISFLVLCSLLHLFSDIHSLTVYLLLLFFRSPAFFFLFFCSSLRCGECGCSWNAAVAVDLRHLQWKDGTPLLIQDPRQVGRPQLRFHRTSVREGQITGIFEVLFFYFSAFFSPFWVLLFRPSPRKRLLTQQHSSPLLYTDVRGWCRGLCTRGCFCAGSAPHKLSPSRRASQR